jgi:DNA-binding transcriptional regulator YdaS (Cro superfamily)
MSRKKNNIRYLEEASRFFGNQSRLAEKLNITPQYVSNWIKGRSKIPLLYALKIDQLSMGKFKFSEFLEKETQCYFKKAL